MTEKELAVTIAGLLIEKDYRFAALVGVVSTYRLEGSEPPDWREQMETTLASLALERGQKLAEAAAAIGNAEPGEILQILQDLAKERG